jgi:hypothetical protein
VETGGFRLRICWLKFGALQKSSKNKCNQAFQHSIDNYYDNPHNNSSHVNHSEKLTQTSYSAIANQKHYYPTKSLPETIKRTFFIFIFIFSEKKGTKIQAQKNYKIWN